MIPFIKLNRTKRFVLLGVLCFLLSGFASLGRAEMKPAWISLSPNVDRNPRLSLLESNPSEVAFEIRIPGTWAETVTVKGGNYSLLSVPGAGVTSRIGEPKVPVITKMVQIPFGAQVSVTVESSEFSEKDLAKLGLVNRIAPVQPPVPKVEGAFQQAQFAMNETYYRQNAFLPENPVGLGEIGVIRGHRFVNVIIYPVSYNPQTGRVRMYSRMKVRLILSGSDMATTKHQLNRYASPPFEELCQKLLVNYQAYAPMVQGALQSPIGYLIITHQNFYSSLAALVRWKTEKGFHVTVAQVPAIGSTKEEIKAYIQNAYDTWSIPPTYVLFVGDTDYIPAWTGDASSTATDLNYVKMDSDNFADVFRGRLPAKTSAEADAMVSKTLYYERPSSTDLNWMGNACFIASSDANLTAEFTHRYVIQNYLLPNGLTVDTLWERLGVTSTQITNSVNAGKTMVCYSGHGSTAGWATGSYTQSNVRGLSNLDEYPFILSHACFTGQFSVSECFGETWAKVANGAGIAFWGASNYTYWDEDDILEKRMFQAAFAETCYSIGNMTDKALWYLYQYYGGGGLSLYYLDAYNVMGDPSVDLWTSPAESLHVTFPPSITPGPHPVTVGVQKPDAEPLYGAFVCLYKDGEVFETGYTDASGQVTLSPSPLTLGHMDVTVTAHNSIPFVDSMQVSPGKGDVTSDGQINAGDLVFLVNYLYREGPAPNPLDMGDVNCNGVVDSGDIIYLVNYLYQGGPAPCSP
ncbi:MAG: C25 family cysteine peptidase [Candidatus Zixiibacteriota bacterium]